MFNLTDVIVYFPMVYLVDTELHKTNLGMLPEEILSNIFKCLAEPTTDYIPDGIYFGTEVSDTLLNSNETLLKCRTVSWDWKNAVDNSPVMGNIWCTISNIREFLNSTIATKVKNLCLWIIS